MLKMCLLESTRCQAQAAQSVLGQFPDIPPNSHRQSHRTVSSSLDESHSPAFRTNSRATTRLKHRNVSRFRTLSGIIIL